MRLGIWCPAPLSIRPDEPVKPAFDALTRHGGGVDGNYLYAVDVLRRARRPNSGQALDPGRVTTPPPGPGKDSGWTRPSCPYRAWCRSPPGSACSLVPV